MTKRGNTKRTKSARRDRSRRRSIGSRKYRGGAEAAEAAEATEDGKSIEELYAEYAKGNIIVIIKTKADNIKGAYPAAEPAQDARPEIKKQYNATIKKLNIDTVRLLCLLKRHLREDPTIQPTFNSIVTSINQNRLNTGHDFKTLIGTIFTDDSPIEFDETGKGKLNTYLDEVFKILNPVANNGG